MRATKLCKLYSLFQVIASKQKAPLKLGTDDGDDDGDQPATSKPVKYMDNVLIDFIGRQSNDITHLDGPIFQSVKGWLVGVGEKDVLVKALAEGLEKLKEGDTAYIWSSAKWALGELGTRKHKVSSNTDSSSKSGEAPTTTPQDQFYTLPINSSVLYEITVTSIVADTSRLNPYFTIQKALTKKNIANDLYQWEWASSGTTREKSIRLYEKAGKDMETLLDGTYFASVEPDHPQRKQCRSIMLDSYNNVIAVYMRAKRFAKAKDAAKVVLKLDKNNFKALLRLAKVCLLDPSTSLEDSDKAISAAEQAIVYKDKEEEIEVKKLRAQWKRKKGGSTNDAEGQ
jgi:tetratricopeptide (TPR) repeat protein